MSLSEQKRPYIIYRPSPGWGFWSNFSVILQGLDEAEMRNLIPVVDMELHPTRYNEDEVLFDTKNSWEYYFEQPGGLSLSKALTLNPLDNQGSATGRFTGIEAIAPSAEIVVRGRELVQKYIRIKPAILAEVDALLPPRPHPDVLGIHVRGTDMRSGYASGHPIPSPPACYLDLAMTLDKESPFSQVFLACDELETVTMFREHFGNRLLTTLAHRNSAHDAFSDDYNWLFTPRRPRHRYLLGLEVLIDVLLLARCGHLMGGISNVSKSAIYFAQEGQILHAVPPVWCAPPHRGPSMGKAYLDSCPAPSRPLSSAALATQIKEMERLLEATENARASAYEEMDQLHVRLVSTLTELQTKHDAWVATQQEIKAVRKENTRISKELQRSTASIKLLQSRLRHLINGWTRLGWRLMPWTKPDWRHKPDIVKLPEQGPGAS